MLTKPVYLEIDKPNYVPIYTVQYDYNSRFYEITILNNSQPLDLTGIRVIVGGKKPDGKEVFNSCKVLDAKKGLIQLELTEQMNAVNGASEYALELFSADGMLSSQPFKLIVTRSTISKSVESSKELGALKDALNEVQDIDNRFAQTNAQLSETKQELSLQLEHKANLFKIKQSDSFEYIKHILENNNNCKITFENGSYLFENEILLNSKSDVEIDFYNSTITVPSLSVMKSILKLENCKNIKLKNCNLDGNREVNIVNTGSQDGGNHGISISECEYIYIENFNISNCGTDGCYLGRKSNNKECSNEHIYFLGCVFDNNSRQGASIISLSNSSFINCRFINTNGKAPQAGIDIEPNSTEIFFNIEFKDCEFSGNSGRGFVIDAGWSSQLDNFTFNNCTFDNNGSDGCVINIKGEATYLKKIYIKNSYINSIYSSGIHTTNHKTFINIQDSDIGNILVPANAIANMYNCNIGRLSAYGGAKILNSVFEGNNTIKDAIYNYGDDELIFNNCVFKNYTRYAFTQIKNCEMTNCVFREFTTNTIEPSNDPLTKLNIFNCYFESNPIRVPSKTENILMVNCNSNMSFPSTNLTLNNRFINCIKINEQ